MSPAYCIIVINNTQQLADWMFSAGVCKPKVPTDDNTGRMIGKEAQFYIKSREPLHEYMKEVHYFNQRWTRKDNYYAGWFKHCKGQELILDATPK